MLRQLDNKPIERNVLLIHSKHGKGEPFNHLVTSALQCNRAHRVVQHKPDSINHVPANPQIGFDPTQMAHRL